MPFVSNVDKVSGDEAEATEEVKVAPKGKSKAKAKGKAKAKAKSEPSSASTPKLAEPKAAVMKRPSALRTPRKDAEPGKFWDDEQEEPKPPAKKVVKRPAAQTSEEGPKVSNPMWYKSSNTFGVRVDGVQKITVGGKYCDREESMKIASNAVDRLRQGDPIDDVKAQAEMKAALSKQGLEKQAREKKKEAEEKEAAAAEQNPEVAPEGLQEAEEEETLDDDAEVEEMAETQPADVE